MFAENISLEEARQSFGITELNKDDRFGLNSNGDLVVVCSPESRNEEYWLLKAPTFVNYDVDYICPTSEGRKRLFFFKTLYPRKKEEPEEGDAPFRLAETLQEAALGLKHFIAQRDDLDIQVRNLSSALVEKAVAVIEQAESGRANKSRAGFKGVNSGDKGN